MHVICESIVFVECLWFLLKDRDLIGVSQLSLCDLAGSERLSRTKADGDRVRQAGSEKLTLII